MRISVIGLGNMGQPMAANLIKAGHEVTGFDLSAAMGARHAAAGGKVAASLAAAAASAEVILTMLPAGRHVAEVYLGEGGVLASCGADALLVDSSTIDVDTARRVAAAAAASGREMLDAPVSGGVRGAAAATLTFMVGGTAAGFARAQPVLAAMGRNIVHAGVSGAGQAAKMCNNMILGISMLGVSEAFVLADRLGLDRQKLFDISSTSSGQCWALLNGCPAPGPVPAAPSNHEYAPGFAAALMLKDLQLSQEAAAATGAATPMGAHAARLYQALVGAGEGGRDFSVAFAWLSKLAREETV
ncbi:MAG: 3-hydroxyisobutyrate dehydrogenase [Rhodospirillales bacterium]|nr:3-hydroxyisobutyrate dehydrogenase [Rhodospirillales bacterium]